MIENRLDRQEVYESVCSYIRRMIHDSPMSWVVGPLEPFMIHARFALRLKGGQTPMYHNYTLAMLGGHARPLPPPRKPCDWGSQ